MKPYRIALLSAICLAVTAPIAGTCAADEPMGKPYVTSQGASGPVKDAYNECWQSGGGTPKALEDCGDVKPKTPAVAAVDGDGDGDGVSDSRDRCPDTPRGDKVDRNGCTIVENLTLNLINDEFDFDSARLKPEMMAALDELASRIAASPGYETLAVVGHTDSVGTDAYNQGLSERRANAVADYLRGKGIGIDDSTVQGMGEGSPIADNGTASGRASNRRVEINTR